VFSHQKFSAIPYASHPEDGFGLLEDLSQKYIVLGSFSFNRNDRGDIALDLAQK
jgi:hypothetical protein